MDCSLWTSDTQFAADSRLPFTEAFAQPRTSIFIPQFGGMLKGMGFSMRREPWTFSDSGLTLHRFLKFEKGEADYYTVDILAANTTEHQKMIGRAETKKWSNGSLKVLNRPDLIEMKKKRGSHADLADIEHLEKPHNENDQG